MKNNTQNKSDYTPPSRILWIDALRGFSIILVVLGHVLLQLGIGGENTALSSVLMSFRMPLFFFISGFFSYRSCLWWTKTRLCDILKRKFTAQILGTLIFFLLNQYFLTSKITFDNGFMGYWFAIALFQMYILYVFVSLLNRRFKTDRVLICMMVVSSLMALLHFRLPLHYLIVKLLAWQNFTHYLQFFTLGLICARFRGKFLSLLSSNRFITFLVVGLVVCLIFWPIKSLENTLLYYIIRYEISKYLAMAIVIVMFYSLAEYWKRDTVFTRFMIYIGQRTLDIYYIHFFFLPNLVFLSPYIISNELSSIQLLLSFTITIVVLTMSLVVSAILRRSQTLRTFLFGLKAVPVG